jgi:predicted amidohydrolase
VSDAHQTDEASRTTALPAGPMPAQGRLAQVDEFTVVERMYSADSRLPSVGLANIHAVVPGIEENKSKIVRAAQVFKERGANMVIFPEFCLTGYFWEDEPACWDYMRRGCTQEHIDWIDRELRPLLDDRFRVIVLNNLSRGSDEGGKFRNVTFILSAEESTEAALRPERSYTKVFLPGIEKLYTESGRDDRLTIQSRFGHGRVGFLTCYDFLFPNLLREYAMIDNVDVLVEIASWRAASTRDYPGMNVRTDLYYGGLWDGVMAASSAVNQVWTFACNAVGRHGISDVAFWGRSGIWAPSGLCLLQASNVNEELLLVHNLDILGAREAERGDFDYTFDFNEIYRPMGDGHSFTRVVDY